MPYVNGYVFTQVTLEIIVESARVGGGSPSSPPPQETGGNIGYIEFNILDGYLTGEERGLISDTLQLNLIAQLTDDVKISDSYVSSETDVIKEETVRCAYEPPEAHGLIDLLQREESFETENSFNHWVLFTHLDHPYIGTVNVDTPLPVSTSSNQQVIASPNTSDGYVLFQFLLGESGVGAGSPNGSDYLQRVYTVSAGSSGQHKHLTLDFRLGYVVEADSSCTPTGYKAIESGLTQEYTAAIGSPPSGYRYQWYFDDIPVGSNSNKYTPPAQANGTYHTVSVAHVPL